MDDLLTELSKQAIDAYELGVCEPLTDIYGQYSIVKD